MNLIWSRELYDTYQNCEAEYAGIEKDGLVLLPVSFTWVNAQIECVLNEKGELLDAYVLEKKDAATMIPCTIDSSNRTSKPVAHPLFDKLSYIAKELKVEHKGKYLYDDYHEKLSSWANMEHAPECLKVLLNYLEQGTFIQDLVKKGVLYLDEHQKLLEKWTGDSKDKPNIFKVLNGSQENAVVRFRIFDRVTHHNESIWMNREVQTSFTDYYVSTLKHENLCMITGERTPITELHSAYLRYAGDSAKLISSQDNLGFKYTGRNTKAEEAVSVGYIASQKAHNALKWLIQKQGYKQNGLVILAWGTKQPDVLDFINGSLDLFTNTSVPEPTTYQGYANQLNIALKGIQTSRFTDPNEDIVIMCMDAATTGRLSIKFYQSMKGSQLLEQIEKWYTSVTWKGMTYFKKNEETGKSKKHFYLGTPSFKMIVDALYGTIDSEDVNKIKKEAYTRLLSCMIDGKPLPRDYISKMFQKFCKVHSFENSMKRDDFTAIACALIRKYRNDLSNKKEEEWSVDVDYNQKETYYLWGRLLAYADWVERRANSFSDEDRITNAMKYLKEFQKTPATTWSRIYQRLIPYRRKFIRANKVWEYEMLEKEMDCIMHCLEMDQHNCESLDDRFILGYGAQLFELKERLYQKKENKDQKEKGEKNNDNIK